MQIFNVQKLINFTLSVLLSVLFQFASYLRPFAFFL